MASDYRGIIRRNATQICEITARIHEEYAKKPHGPEHRAACRVFFEKYDSLAFPGGLHDAMEMLKSGDTEIVEAAIQYLEVNPRFFGSGYITEEILHRLKRVILTPEQITRLVHLTICRVVDAPGRIFDRYVRLAGALGDKRILDAACEMSVDPRRYIKTRAERIINIIKT